MSVQDDKQADQEDRAEQDRDEQEDRAQQEGRTQQEDRDEQDGEQHLTEKPEPDEDDKKVAAKMMEAYKDKPTIVLPGTGGSVSGTAVNDWLDEDGNPKHEEPEGGESGADAEGREKAQDKSQDKGQDVDDDTRDEQALQDQIEKDKALNDQLREAAKEENKGEKG